MIRNNIKKLLYGLASLILCIAVTASCSDKDEHYSVSKDVEGRVSLWERISQQPELSIFATMLQRYAYDRLLSGEQVYTVWAPENDALAGINLDDSVAVTRIIATHIARYSYPASGVASERNPVVYMLNAKQQAFVRSGDGYTMKGVELHSQNLLAKNGILHTLKDVIPFTPNIWQTMEEPGFDAIRQYLYAFSKREFSRNTSEQIGYNDEGMIVYDSVFTTLNTMWYTYKGANGIGWLNREDSTYTMILPDNKAWEEAYNRYYPLYKPNPSLGNTDSIQRANTQYGIVQDLVFRGEINPASYGVGDSIISTRGAIIKNPARIFSGSSPIQSSNGLVYPVSSLKYTLEDSYVKPIWIEAEAAKIWHEDKRDQGTINFMFNWDNSAISNKGYLNVKSLGISTNQPSVSFEIPGVLAAKYDIYAVFLSPVDANPISVDTTVIRVKFEIQQWTGEYEKANDKSWKNVGATMSDDSSPDFVTKKREIARIKATKNGPFEFPFANFNEKDNVFRIKVTSYTTRNDNSSTTNKFNTDKAMRIDYLQLVPYNP